MAVVVIIMRGFMAKAGRTGQRSKFIVFLAYIEMKAYEILFPMLFILY